MSSPSVSLTRYLIEEQHAGRIGADLRLLIEVVARACKTISVAVGKGALGGVLGEIAGGGAINVQGCIQKPGLVDQFAPSKAKCTIPSEPCSAPNAAR